MINIAWWFHDFQYWLVWFKVNENNLSDFLRFINGDFNVFIVILFKALSYSERVILMMILNSINQKVKNDREIIKSMKYNKTAN